MYDHELNQPIPQFHMSNLFAASQDDTYDYLELEHVTCEIGLNDGPINTISPRRGASEKEMMGHLKTVQEASKSYKHNDYLGPANDRAKLYETRLKKFAEASKSDVYLVFFEDCQQTDEWNLFANWFAKFPEHVAVWQRRMVPWTEAVERIRQMKPLAPKPKLPFTLDPICKRNIDELLPKLQEIKDEDNTPYKLVTEQKILRYVLGQHYAILAANKLRVLMGGHTPPYVSITSGYILNIQLCQYDNWDGWYEFFKKHCKIDEWDRSYNNFPTAYWDLSDDPDFERSEQKVYPIVTENNL